MLEVEMKFPLAERSHWEARLSDCGAVWVVDRREEDHYFNAPDRNFAQTDEALRLRRIGEANFLTYKGPKRDTLTKTRTEIEVPLACGDAAAQDMQRVLVALGYKPVAVVRKQRRIYRLERDGWPMEITLDEVESLGHFVEIEVRTSEERFELARDALVRLAESLDLNQSERRSYLQMLLQLSPGS